MKNQTHLKNLVRLIVIVMLVIPFQSCETEDDELPVQSLDPYLHVDEFGELLEENFGPQSVGMQYSIVQNGNLELNNSIGFSRLAVDGGDIDYHELQRKSIHSCSKTISAVTLMQLLNFHGISVDTKITEYLPSRWDTEMVELTAITFRQLLQHRSGLRGTHDSYQAMRDYIENTNFEPKDEVYSNINFSLMRILIPNINETERLELEGIMLDHGEEFYAQEVSDRYVQKVVTNILAPSGISSGVTPKIWDIAQFPETVYNYNFKDQSIPGYKHTDQTLLTGAGGWYMNAKELAAFVTYLSSNNLQNVNYQFLSENELGMYSVNRSGVDYFTHNGASGTIPTGRGGRAIWMHIPERDVIVTIQINSANVDFTMAELAQGIINAYLASIHI